MFATKMHHTVGHTEIQAYGDIDLCIPIQNTSRVYELGTYQAKHGMMPQTRYAFPTEPNRAMKVGLCLCGSLSHHLFQLILINFCFTELRACDKICLIQFFFLSLYFLMSDFIVPEVSIE